MKWQKIIEVKGYGKESVLSNVRPGTVNTVNKTPLMHMLQLKQDVNKGMCCPFFPALAPFIGTFSRE
jgi:23S rRNA A1618 N6-methylase RlmF